ncbi:MAG: SMP-30/gluconolactonase/LRE family protein [Chloroflexota bacterium]
MVALDIRDERLLDIITLDTPLEQHLTGFRFTEGPIWHPTEQHLRFSDIMGNAIYQWDERDGLQLIRMNSHLANGNTYDRQGRMLTCHHGTSRVTRIENDGSISVLASHYQGTQLNSPNDIVVKRDGSIYFTDPMSGRSEKFGIPRESDLGYQGVYQLDPETLNLTLLVDDFVLPNGLCFSLNESQLFINDSRRFQVRVFDVNEDGTLSNGRIWAETTGDGVGVPDGMKFDSVGNLFTCGQGGIHIFAPDATCLGRILLPEQTANFVWGDADLQSLYITASTSVYRLRMTIVGLPIF